MAQTTSKKKPKGFKAVSKSIQTKQGISKSRADAIAAVAGRKNLGKAEMTRRSVAGRKKKKTTSKKRRK